MSWKLYLSRPFNLFNVSIWHEWYASPDMLDIVGVTLAKALYIEFPKGTVRQYRVAQELDALFESSAQKVLEDPHRIIQLLKEGVDLNAEAEKILAHQTLNFNESIEFLVRLAQLSTILPYFVGLAMEKHEIVNTEMSELIMKLRSASYYPRIFEEVINPLATEKLRALGFDDQNILEHITYKELKSGDTSNIEVRSAERINNKFFMYRTSEQGEEITHEHNTEKFVNEIENRNSEVVRELKGMIACKGKATGKVRLVLKNNPKGVEFDQGDILVAISTSPELVSIMKKAGAIVTDEGGITAHAAIISRELNIPCIIGTKVATHVLKDGDIVEVDAEKGIVKIIK